MNAIKYHLIFLDKEPFEEDWMMTRIINVGDVVSRPNKKTAVQESWKAISKKEKDGTINLSFKRVKNVQS